MASNAGGAEEERGDGQHSDHRRFYRRSKQVGSRWVTADYLIKPIRQPVLLEAIRKHVPVAVDADDSRSCCRDDPKIWNCWRDSAGRGIRDSERREAALGPRCSLQTGQCSAARSHDAAMNGFEVIGHIRKEATLKELPIFVMTAKTLAEERLRFFGRETQALFTEWLMAATTHCRSRQGGSVAASGKVSGHRDQPHCVIVSYSSFCAFTIISGSPVILRTCPSELDSLALLLRSTRQRRPHQSPPRMGNRKDTFTESPGFRSPTFDLHSTRTEVPGTPCTLRGPTLQVTAVWRELRVLASILE